MKKSNGKKCNAITKSGKKCENNATNGSKCGIHKEVTVSNRSIVLSLKPIPKKNTISRPLSRSLEYNTDLLAKELDELSFPFEGIDLAVDACVKLIFDEKPTLSENKRILLENTYGDISKYTDGFKITKKIGEGAYGSIYKLEKRGKKPRAIKFVILHNRNFRFTSTVDFEKEIAFQEHIKDAKITPKIFNSAVYKHNKKTVGIIIMEFVSGNLEDLIKLPLTNVQLNAIMKYLYIFLKHLCEYNIVHRDIHWANLAFSIDNNYTCALYLIDWGLAKDGPCYPCLEISQLLRTLHLLNKQGQVDKNNFEYLLKRLEILYQDAKCGAFVTGDFKTWDAEYRSYLKKIDEERPVYKFAEEKLTFEEKNDGCIIL